MSAKISALTTGTNMGPGDLLVAVQSGVNTKITQAMAARNIGANTIQYGNSLGVLQVSSTGQIALIAPAGEFILLEIGSHEIIAQYSSGTLILSPTGGDDFAIANNNAIVGLTTAGGIVISVASGQICSVPFSSAPSSVAWATSQPTTVHDAINRIANAWYGHFLTQIP